MICVLQRMAEKNIGELSLFVDFPFPGKALLTKYYLLVQSPFLHLVFCLDCHGSHLAKLAQLMHQKLAQQLVSLVTTRSSNALLVTTMILPASFSTQMTTQSKTYSARTPILSSTGHLFWYSSSPAFSSVYLAMELWLLLVSLYLLSWQVHLMDV